MSNINDTITYGTAKFKVVKNITSENIKDIGINGNSELEYLLRKNNTIYNVGNIVFSANLPSNLILKCTTAGTTASTEPDFSMAEENDTIIDGSVEWICKKLLVGGENGTVISVVEVTQAEYNALSSDEKMDESVMYVITNAIPSGEVSPNEDGVPVATILPFSGNGNLPIGYLLCDGSAVSRAAYPDLFSIIGTTFGAGNGVDTFNLPDLTDKFIEGDTTAGTEKEAGLPNITGGYTYARMSSNSTNTNGALYVSSRYGSNYVGSSSSIEGTITLDASRSSAVYGNSNTVQPPALTMRYIIKAFTGMDNDEALVDLTEIANDLNQKFDPRSDFTIIYPNGGTAANPANITNNSRYVMDNPFSGYQVDAKVEIYYNNVWGEINNMVAPSNSTAQGIIVSSYNEQIVIQTAYTSLTGGYLSDGNPFMINTHITSAPCRVKVWKVGKIPTA